MASVNHISIFRRKVSGATLLEVVVALVILLMVTGFGFVIFTRMTETHFYNQQLRARQLAVKTLVETEKGNRFSDQTTEDGNLKVIRKVTPYKDKANGWKVVVRVTNKAGDELIKREKILLADE